MKWKNTIYCILILIFLINLELTAKTTLQKKESLNRLTIYTEKKKGTIAPEIYGHFAEHLGRCIYDGLWVGPDSRIPNVRGIRKDVLEALKKLNIPVLRWPGGCFADEYFWMDGIGPREKRPSRLNTRWGMVIDNNAFGTHEFMDLCELLGCEAYIAGNMGTGTPKEMKDWLEYMTFDGDSEMANLRRKNGRNKPWKVKYFGVGNESWGCGGKMRPEYYADLYNRYSTFLWNYSGNRVTTVACGPNAEDAEWMDIVLKETSDLRWGTPPDAISWHYYVMTGPWDDKGDATIFDGNEWFILMENTLKVRKLLQEQIKMMDKHDPHKKIGLYVDEWGIWWNAEPDTHPRFLYQQNTLRDAVSAGIFLNEFNNACDRVRMANIAQMVNVLQAMILTKGEKMILTPTYHVFEMYKVHHGAALLENDMVCNVYEENNKKLPMLNVSASKDQDGVIHVTLCNLDPKVPSELECTLEGARVKNVSGRVLTAKVMDAHNTFEKPNTITPAILENIGLKDNQIYITLPSKSVVLLEIRSPSFMHSAN